MLAAKGVVIQPLTVNLKNFRSVREQAVPLGPITVVYGPNGTGKSSLLYGLAVLRNVVLGPSQAIQGFFNLRSINLGGLAEVAYGHDPKEGVELGITLEAGRLRIDYRLAFLEPSAGRFSLSFNPLDEAGPPVSGSLRLDVAFPYSGGQQAELRVPVADQEVLLLWNGFAFTVAGTVSPAAAEGLRPLLEALNAPVERLRRVALVPLVRGFFQPHYSPVPLSAAPVTGEEVASLLAMNPDLEFRVSHYLEKVVGRQLRVRARLGTSIFSLYSIDRETGLGVELVNEGFGVNQLVYLLALSLWRESGVVCIEEPEIHLHPGAVRRLARALVEIVGEDGPGRHFVISTHSEPLVLEFLSLVAEGKLKPRDLACYLAVREGQTTRFERQAVNERGQIEGGLGSFLEGELEQIRAFLGLPAAQE